MENDVRIKGRTALLAKKRNYKEDCVCYYMFDTPKIDIDGGILQRDYNRFSTNWNKWFDDLRITHASAPTQSMLRKWIRDKHYLHIVIIPTVTAYYTYKIVDVQLQPENPIERPPYKDVNGTDYQTYEDALEAAMVECLTNIIPGDFPTHKTKLRQFKCIQGAETFDDFGASGSVFKTDMWIKDKIYEEADQSRYSTKIEEGFIVDETGCLHTIGKYNFWNYFKEII